jgi:hypothetical protein
MNNRLIAIVWCLLTICGHADDQKKSDPLVGTVDANGRVIVHVFNAGEGRKRPAALATDYGIVMCRHADWVLFALGDRAKQSVQEFMNYDDFLEALKAIPKKSTITIYDRCLMPTFYDFYPVHEELYDKFKKDCKDRGLKVAGDSKITCTCPDAALEPPKKQAKAVQRNANGEQDGGGQPATKPADKPPVKGEPSTPTPKDGPQ